VSRSEAPEVVALPGPLAALVALYGHGGATIPALSLGPIDSITGLESGSKQPAAGTVTISESGQAVLSLNGHFREGGSDGGVEARLIEVP